MTHAPSVHTPVLLAEVLDWLQPREGSVIVDGTLGGGGHTRALAERVGKSGRVISLDRDAAAIQRAQETLADLPVTTVQANFCNLPEVLETLDLEKVDGVVLDLGLSSDQLADDSRGFSFAADGPLDLRFDTERGEPASRLVNRLQAEHLADLIYAYGEERHSRRIARAIVERRRNRPIETAGQLAEIVRRAIPGPRKKGQIDPATRTFQALRIAVNEELKSLEIALRRIPDCLKVDGRLGIISFHSLEDRRVKEAFRDDSRLEALTRKPIRPGEGECEVNPRSRSAKFRVARRAESEDDTRSVNP
ncbi:MAG: 16S rRNA (cytosine(1402)-N(4))-methyltransferase RsmH [Planctomycetaceae bacterium]|nr:16S rRNA (cytosine(1402)-N(4))-methyltransferase RsmH [Planctomycetaceae bacterium]